MKLSDQEKVRIRELAARVEAQTGVQVLAVVTGKSDIYPEVPWKAFSLGAAMAALALATGSAFELGRVSTSPFVWGTAVLGAGMISALAGIFLQPVARCFLGKERAEEEARQYAQSLFLERILGRERSRKAILLLASQLERRAAVLADTGITGRIPETEFEKIASAMDAVLAGGSAPDALAGGLLDVEKLLLRHGFARASAGDDIPEEFLEREGPNS